jgi:hypothetical protein
MNRVREHPLPVAHHGSESLLDIDDDQERFTFIEKEFIHGTHKKSCTDDRGDSVFEPPLHASS